MTQKHRYQLWFLSLAAVILLFLYINGVYTAKKLSFSGIVDSVSYNINMDPTLTINDSVYKPRSNNWAFRGEIEKGDSLIKVKNTMVIKLIKRKTKKVIFFY